MAVPVADGNGNVFALGSTTDSDGYTVFKQAILSNGKPITTANPVPTCNTPSTPSAAYATHVATANQAIIVFPAGSIANYAYVYNPPSAPGILYIDIVTTAAYANNTTFPLSPGVGFELIRGITTAFTAISATAGHTFIAVRY